MANRWLLSLMLGAGLVLIESSASADLGKLDRAACTYNGKPLYGKVQVVNAFPDIKIQVVEAFPDLQVQTVKVFPDRCGQWQVVTVFPDLKVQYVEAFPDLKIQYVRVFPGLKK